MLQECLQFDSVVRREYSYMRLFISADKISDFTGGGLVCKHESMALESLGPTMILDGQNPTPFVGDEELVERLTRLNYSMSGIPGIAHFYSGSWTKSVRKLKELGWKVSITCAAHSIKISKEEHEKLGIPFNYPHLTDEKLWEQYSACYRECDLLICPSQRAKEINIKYGCKNRIEVIPHGCEIPEKVKPLPNTFTCGYLGSFGPDKGVRYLLEAWRDLKYKDATLVLAGRDSLTPFASHLIREYGGGNIRVLGWLNKVSDFYNLISLYIQPSATEGFGIEVVEAMAHARTVICSANAGAADLASHHVEGRSSEQLAERIDEAKNHWDLQKLGEADREKTKSVTWEKVREMYCKLWQSL
jgi:glycosyltransferase involved in cell wall biosynthesis